ncbi:MULTISPECIES: RDD family protein [Isoptericola]|uniref:RDD family protein n=1 Tax=Isoptericola TaxID=254250 RepID=UPI000D04F009|nr:MULTISPECIES: RDD family protein [Isoptericola]
MTTTVPTHARSPRPRRRPRQVPPRRRPPLGPEPLVDGHEKAGWLLRVLAVLLDSAVVASIAWLATSDAPTYAALPLLHRGEQPQLGSDAVSWTVGSLLGLGILQAYTGMTPGKRVCGISVVDAGSGRPIGMLGTVLRWLAHFLDAFLLLGYLRATWHPEGRTYADSLLGTVVVTSTRPRPHRWVAWLRRLRDARAPWLRWPRIVTSGVSLVVCAAAAAMSLVQGSGGSGHFSSDMTSCTSTSPFVATATIGSAASATWESRLGIERPVERSWEVAVVWSAALGVDDGGNPPLDAPSAALEVRAPDGSFYSAEGGPMPDDEPGADADNSVWWSVPEPIASVSVEAPQDLSGATATAVLLDDGGTLLARCTVPVPATEHEEPAP